jgi:hypothetical protein
MPTETVEVLAITGMATLKGLLHVNSADKAHRRISDALNNDQRNFIVLTNVTVQPFPGQSLPSPQLGQGKLPFLYINRLSIQMMCSVGNESEEPTTKA